MPNQRKAPQTLAQQLGGPTDDDLIRQALAATSEKLSKPAQPAKPASKPTGAAAPVGRQTSHTTPPSQPAIEPPAPTKPAAAQLPASGSRLFGSAPPAARPQPVPAPKSGSRPWGSPAAGAAYRPGRRPPGRIEFSFAGRVEDGRTTDNGKYLLRCAGDGWYSIYAEAIPDWLVVGSWVAISGIIAAGSGGTLFLWAREFSAINPIQE